MFIQVPQLALLSTRIVVSGVPQFIPNETLEMELRRHVKFASSFKSVGLGCKTSETSIYVPRYTEPKSGGFLLGEAWRGVIYGLNVLSVGMSGIKVFGCAHRQQAPMVTAAVAHMGEVDAVAAAVPTDSSAARGFALAVPAAGSEAQGYVAPAPLPVSWASTVSGVWVSVTLEPRAAPDVREKADVDF